jgi:hypothetical protein
MVTPGTTADWIMAAGLLGAVAAVGATGYRWILRDEGRASARTAMPELAGNRMEDAGRVREARRIG